MAIEGLQKLQVQTPFGVSGVTKEPTDTKYNSALSVFKNAGVVSGNSVDLVAAIDKLGGDRVFSLASDIGISKDAVSSASDFIKNNIRLDSGEWINKESYNKLSEFEQSQLNSLGINMFNEWYGYYSWIINNPPPSSEVPEITATIQGITPVEGSIEWYQEHGIQPNIGHPSTAQEIVYSEGAGLPESVLEAAKIAVESGEGNSPQVAMSYLFSIGKPIDINPIELVDSLGEQEAINYLEKANIEDASAIVKEASAALKAQQQIASLLSKESAIRIEAKKDLANYISEDGTLDLFALVKNTPHNKLPSLYKTLTKTLGYDFRYKDISEISIFLNNYVEVKDGFVAKSDWNNPDMFTSKMQEIAKKEGLAALSTEKLTVEQKFEKYRDWGLIPQNTAFTGEYIDPDANKKTGEPSYITADNVQDIEKARWADKYQAAMIAYHAGLVNKPIGAGIGISPYADTKPTSHDKKFIEYWKNLSTDNKVLIASANPKLSTTEKLKIATYSLPIVSTVKTAQEHGMTSGWTIASIAGDILIFAPAISKGLGLISESFIGLKSALPKVGIVPVGTAKVGGMVVKVNKIILLPSKNAVAKFEKLKTKIAQDWAKLQANLHTPEYSFRFTEVETPKWGYSIKKVGVSESAPTKASMAFEEVKGSTASKWVSIQEALQSPKEGTVLLNDAILKQLAGLPYKSKIVIEYPYSLTKIQSGKQSIWTFATRRQGGSIFYTTPVDDAAIKVSDIPGLSSLRFGEGGYGTGGKMSKAAYEAELARVKLANLAEKKSWELSPEVRKAIEAEKAATKEKFKTVAEKKTEPKKKVSSETERLETTKREAEPATKTKVSSETERLETYKRSPIVKQGEKYGLSPNLTIAIGIVIATTIKTSGKPLTITSPEVIDAATKTFPLIQTIIQSSITGQTATDIITKQAIEQSLMNIAKTNTQNMTNLQVKQLIEQETKLAVANQTKLAMQTAVSIQVKQQIKLKQATVLRLALRAVNRIAEKARTRALKIRLPLLKDGDKQVATKIANKIYPRGTVALRTGKLRSKVWHIIEPPYRKQDYTMAVSDTPPKGATVTTAKKVADTIQLLGGKLDKDLILDIGAFDLHIYKTRAGERPVSKFVRDVKTRTHHELSAKEARVTTSSMR